MTTNPFAARIATAAAEIADAPRRDGLDRPTRAAFEQATVRTTITNQVITERQHDYAVSLLDERDVTAHANPKYVARLIVLRDSIWGTDAPMRDLVWDLTKVQASALISTLLSLPIRQRAEKSAAQLECAAAYGEVPAGHYALEQDGAVTFYRVDRPTEGKWAGKVFVSLQHGDEYTNMSRAAGETMLMRILDQGAALCSAMYGRHIGKCGVCNRTLTNEASRAAGIGPKCAANAGW